MTSKEAIVHMEEIRPKKCKMVDGRLQGGFPDHDSDTGKAIDSAIDALQKVEAYESFIEYFVFEGGYGDYSAMCEYMTWHNDTWCSEHCRADKPNIECVVKWSEERGE